MTSPLLEVDILYAVKINLSKFYFIFVPLGLPRIFFLFIFSDNNTLIQIPAQTGKLGVILTLSFIYFLHSAMYQPCWTHTWNLPTSFLPYSLHPIVQATCHLPWGITPCKDQLDSIPLWNFKDATSYFMLISLLLTECLQHSHQTSVVFHTERSAPWLLSFSDVSS